MILGAAPRANATRGHSLRNMAAHMGCGHGVRASPRLVPLTDSHRARTPRSSTCSSSASGGGLVAGSIGSKPSNGSVFSWQKAAFCCEASVFSAQATSPDVLQQRRAA